MAQKAIAVGLLPLFTRHVSAAGYGAVEILLQTTFAIGMFVRFGVVEAMFRFHPLERTPERRAAVVRATGTFLVSAATVAAVVLVVAAEPASRLLLDQSEPRLVRIAAVGLWAQIVAEFLLAIFRLQERPAAYLVAMCVNVGATTVLSIWLVVFDGLGATGLLAGNVSGTLVMVAGLVIVHRRRLAGGPVGAVLRPLLAFGAPLMIAELTLFAINVIDRVAIARYVGLAEAGLYAIAMKLSQGAFLALQGFNLAWAPLAYSIDDDEEARAFYARVLTYVAMVGAVVLLATSLLAPWLVRLLTAPAFYPAHEAVPLISLAVVLYAVYLTMIVAVGRARRTRVLLVAALAGLVVDLVLLAILVPRYGMIGAAIALAGCFVTALPVLYLFVRRLFPLALEWRRLATVSVTAGAGYALGASMTPDFGVVAFCLRAAIAPLFLVVLLISGFFGRGEARRLSPTPSTEPIRVPAERVTAARHLAHVNHPAGNNARRETWER